MKTESLFTLYTLFLKEMLSLFHNSIALKLHFSFVMTSPPALPSGPMRSTWRADRARWNLKHHLLDSLNVYAVDIDKPAPVFPKEQKVPYLTQWSVQRFIILHAAWPMMLQFAYASYFGHNMDALAAFVLYTLAFQINLIHELWILRRLAYSVGFLDGSKSRDEIPDTAVTKTLFAVIYATVSRPFVTFLFAYETKETVSLTFWLPIELALYSIILDLFFYIAHRAMHEIDWLWKFHRTHHLTKHPVSILSAYADTEQGTLEILIIPMLTYGAMRWIGFPMGFHTWWICHSFLIFHESIGHSGLRLYLYPPGTSWIILQPFNCEAGIEDHDLHHRFGYRRSFNYGKQSLVWDRIFGTKADRIETANTNIDFHNKINFPLM